MRIHLLHALAGCIVAASMIVPVSAARADDTYYVMIFAAEGRPNVARLAHTFAVFIKVDGKQNVGTHTISWLPATLDVRLLFQLPEQGVNLSLRETLKYEASQGAVLSAWGPFEIRQDLYDRALQQIERLQTGKVAYKALDRRFRPGAATNCFHAISDIVDGPLLDTGTAFGVPASQMVLQHLARWFVAPQTIHHDLAERLKLDDYAIDYRNEAPAVLQPGAR